MTSDVLPRPARKLSRPRTFALTLFAGVAGLAVFAINAPDAARPLYPRAFAAVAALPEAAPLTAGQRVLVVSPHPDDETLCCAGSIQQARDAGADVHVVWLTNGDAFELDAVLLDRAPRPSGAQLQGLGQRRIGEARAAGRVLGLPEDHLHFLGYPDGGLLHLFLEHYDTPYRSKTTGATRVPYGAALRPGAAYTGRNVERDLADVMEKVQPDVILVPSPEDHHQDHRATGYFAARVAAERGELSRLRYWIVHGGLEWPLPKGLHESLPLTIPPRGQHLAWERVPLTPQQEARKLAALEAHASQMDVMKRFLVAFVRENELITRQVLPDPIP